MLVQSLPSVSIELIKYTGTPILCVFGCLMNDNGKKIKKEMLEWLTTKYDVVAVNQAYPGKLFEYPAMAFAQYAAKRFNKPILYIHTKGAFYTTNSLYSQNNVRELWKNEFITNYDWYLKSTADVSSPFTGDKDHSTWWNGFVAKPRAWAVVPEIQFYENRYVYEHLFAGTPVTTAARIFPVNCNTPFEDKMLDYVSKIEVTHE